MHVAPALWTCFQRPGVRLACSYYSDRADQHVAVTGRAGSHTRTRSNIIEAVRRSIPLRVGVVGLTHDQRTEQAIVELWSLGVPMSLLTMFGGSVVECSTSTAAPISYADIARKMRWPSLPLAMSGRAFPHDGYQSAMFEKSRCGISSPAFAMFDAS